MTCYLRLFYSDIRFMNTIQRASRLSAATRKYIYMKLIYVCVKPLSFRNAVSCWGCVYSFSSWRREHRLMWCLRRRPSGESSYQHADHPTLYFPLPFFLPGVTLLPHFSRLMINFFFFFLTILVIITCFLHWQCVVCCAVGPRPPRWVWVGQRKWRWERVFSISEALERRIPISNINS